jgi:hypothetical protein
LSEFQNFSRQPFLHGVLILLILEITDVQVVSVTYSMEVRFFVPTNHFTMMMQFFDWPVMLRIIY